jgi:ribosomal protein L37AE/L43A
MTTLATFRDLTEALLAQGKLQAAGIECTLADDNIVRMDWFYSNAVGGVKLQVSEGNLEEASALLQDGIPEILEQPGITYPQPRCPTCSSTDVEHGKLNRPISYFLMWIGFPIPIPEDVWRCHACGAKWKWEGEGEYDDSREPSPNTNHQNAQDEKDQD